MIVFLVYSIPIAYMYYGLLWYIYAPTFELFLMVHVGKYTIHGWYVILITKLT